MIDYEKDMGASSASDVTMSDISKLAGQYVWLANEVKQAETRLKELKASAYKIQTEDIPDAMANAGMAEFMLDSGQKVKVADIVSGSIPSQARIEKAKGEDRLELITRKNDCLHWLNNQGAGAIVRNVATIDVGKDNDEAVRFLIEFAKQANLQISVGKTVHPSTLNSLLKEKIQQGVDVPADIFGLFTGKKATVK